MNLLKAAAAPSDVVPMTFRGAHLVSLLIGLVVLGLGAKLLLAGSSTTATPSSAPAVEQAVSVQADADFREASTAATAYFADNGSYDGMTQAALRSYDAALPSDVVVATASGAAYCLQATAQGTVYSRHGPGGPTTAGPC